MANETKLNMTLLLRRAPFDNSCVLKEGEPGYHTITKEFKVGDGSTPWIDLPFANRTQIETIVNTAIADHAYTKKEIDDLLDALEQAIGKVASDLSAEVTAREQADTGLQNQINTKLATETFNTWKGTHENDHAPSATQIASDIADAVAAEADLRKDADDAINAKIGTGFDDGDNTVAKKIEAAIAAAAADATSKADAAKADAIAEAERRDAARAQTAANALSEAKTELEGKISSGDSATLKSAKDYTDEKVAAETELRIAADNALDGRLDTVEAKLNNVSNVMDFVGAADALPAEGNNQSGDVIVITAGKDAGKEFVYDDSREAGKKWVEFGSTSATDAAVAGLKSRMEAAEGDIDQAQADILALGTNKLGAKDFSDWRDAHELDHAAKQEDITSDIATAKSEAITKAGELDTALHTLISKEIDDDVKAAIDAEVKRANGAYDATGSAAAAQSAAIAEAGRLDATLKTAIEGTSDDASSKATIAGAKKYAEEKAEAARSAAVSAAANDATSKANTAKSEAISAAAGDATTKANAAKSEAIAAVVGTAADEADDNTIEGVRKAFAAADVTTLTSAQTYADTVAANAVKNNIKSGNDDIVITRPDSGEDKDKTIISHKVYGSGTYTKPDSVNDANFVTGVTIENGHVTGASVKSLAEALAAMEFIFDGGTSAN